jgi:hypothetical protein
MADIDKSLPNVKTSIEVDPQEEIEIEEQKVEELSGSPVEVNEQEDGSVEVNFDPSKVNIEGQPTHFDNLAELLPEDITDPIGNELVENYMDYKSSRRDWEQTYKEGLDLLGFKYNNRTEPFTGASGATHPVLAEAVTQFQAGAYKELLPAEGPVRTQIVGNPDQAKEAQALRVKDYMNYELMEKMEEYEPEFDQMLFHLPLAGSTFKKVYYDELLGRAVSKFVPADDLVVPYSATSLDDADAIIETIKISENDLRKQQVAGFYSDIELQKPQDKEDEIQKKERELEGTRKSGKQEMVHTLLECHVNLDLEGFEDKDDELNPTGIKLPYIVTVDETSRKVLSIRRNYEPTDPKRNKIQYFVHFKFLPGLGFYGFGLIHMIGGLSRTATAALRQLLDAGTLSNLPAGFKQRGIRVRDEAAPLQPGEFRDVDAPGGNLRDAFMTLPYKEPSPTLLQLMGIVVQAGQRFAAIADMQVGDGNQGAAVGTTVALLERGSRVMSAIHKRLYAGMKKEFRLLAKVFKTYLPPVYPFDVVGGRREIKQMDFDDRVDILPVADPNIFSMAQRISDPSLEHINALGAKPFQAFRGQDHRAHVTAHLTFMSTNIVRNNPMVMASIQKNILEHISLMAQEQVELEFAEQLQQLQVLQVQAQQDPRVQQQLQQFSQTLEARKAVLVAELTADFAKEEKEITSQYDNDPLLKLKSREVDLRAMENERKKQADQEKADLDRAKLVQARELAEDKMDQNEDLAKLRAGVSLAGKGISQANIMMEE